MKTAGDLYQRVADQFVDATRADVKEAALALFYSVHAPETDEHIEAYLCTTMEIRGFKPKRPTD